MPNCRFLGCPFSFLWHAPPAVACHLADEAVIEGIVSAQWIELEQEIGELEAERVEE